MNDFAPVNIAPKDPGRKPFYLRWTFWAPVLSIIGVEFVFKLYNDVNDIDEAKKMGVYYTGTQGQITMEEYQSLSRGEPIASVHALIGSKEHSSVPASAISRLIEEYPNDTAEVIIHIEYTAGAISFLHIRRANALDSLGKAIRDVREPGTRSNKK
jgi:hypothetical protein